MFLKDLKSGDLIRVDDLETLCNPWKHEVYGRDQAGEEEQDWSMYSKAELIFPSGERLPRCWVEPHYRAAT